MKRSNHLLETPEHGCISSSATPLILGAGGWNIFHHFGVIDSLHANEIEYGEILGVSAGATAAAFLSNGFSPADVTEIMIGLKGDRWKLDILLNCFTIADPIAMALGGTMSLKPYFSEIIEKYGLKPNNRLKIVACDFFTREPVVFQGCDYDLAEALAGSGSVPSVFQPVWHYRDGRMMLLVDGAVYHYSPTEFTSGPCIVSNFRKASEPPREWEVPYDLYVHFREMFLPIAGNNRYVDDRRHLVITTGLPHVAGLNAGISEETCREMVVNGRRIADAAIEAARSEGRICREVANA